MSTQTIYTRPLKMMVLGFVAFTLAAGSLAFAQRIGFIQAPLEKRAMGLIIGVLVMVTGNFLPKTPASERARRKSPRTCSGR